MSGQIEEKKIFYGWIVALTSLMTVAVSTAGRQSIIIFFPVLIEEFGWSRAALSLASSINGVTASLCALVVGFLSEKWEIKKILLAGAVIAAVGLYLCSATLLIWQIYLYFGILVGFGANALGILPNTIIVSNWFRRRRGTAIGIVTSGSGAGTLLFFPLLQWIISRWGWQAGYISLAVLIGPLLISLILLLQRAHPEEMGLAIDGAPASSPPPIPPDGGKQTGATLDSSVRDEPYKGPSSHSRSREGGSAKTRLILARAVKSRRFRFTYAQFILGPLSTSPITIHQAAFFRDQGLDAITTAWIVGLYGFFVFLGMLASGSLSDRINREKSYTIGTGLLLAGCVCLMLSTLKLGLLPPLLYSLFFGLGFGTRPSMDAATAADIFKGKHFGIIFGFLSSGLGVGQILGPFIGGIVYDATGSYIGAFVFCMAALIVATGCIWNAAPRCGGERLFEG
ncbi:MAG TPA: MFS transporter [Spirochaetia bacterium]|nr:MFS transporter [Spirochaetia bacterium]